MKPLVPIAVAVVEQEGCFLVGRRPEGASLAGLAEFPGGKVEPQETPAEAALRECREETGLEVEVRGLLLEQTHHYEHASVRLHFFACAVRDGAAAPKPPFRWVAREALGELEFPPANQRLLETLLSGRQAT